MQYSMLISLTSRVDADYSDIESTELGRQKLDKMICRSFTCGIAGQIHIRRIMHTGARTRHYDGTTADVSAYKSIA